jgi:histidinol-phosphatase (PHP family)
VRIRTSYHTHNRFCDGRGEIAEYVEAAAAAGLDALGISSHSPLTFPDEAAMRAELLPAYCAEVARLREANRDRLRVHLSLEFDYIPERDAELWALVEPYPFEYLIGSVHFIGEAEDGMPWAFDLSRRGFEAGLRRHFGGDIRRLVGAYYERIRGLTVWGRAVIVGHLDRIKKWNTDGRYFKEEETWYRREVEATLAACARAGLIVELNTIGWGNAVRDAYPSPWILRRAIELGIAIVVTTDAHAPRRVIGFHTEALARLQEVGCAGLAVLRDGDWHVEPLERPV